MRLDHTLPAHLLWPLQHGPTSLCADCNGAKAEQWPSAFYPMPEKLRDLSRLTGIPYDILAGEPFINPDAVRQILSDVDGFISRWIHYPEDVKRIQQLIRDRNGIDIYESATTVPEFLK